MAGHSRMPPSKHFGGPARTVQHRDEEKAQDYASSLRSTFVNPESHSSFYPNEGPAVIYLLHSYILYYSPVSNRKLLEGDWSERGASAC